MTSQHVDSPHVLILTNPEDYHAFVISACLERKGIPHALWYAADFPALQKASVWIGGSQEVLTVTGPELSLATGMGVSAVWQRRAGRPVIPDDVDPRDRLFAYRECWTFLNGARRAIGDGAFWVNPPEGFARASLKIEQLRSAIKNGFKIPETLMSNDPSEIRSFVAARAGKVVYKAFFPFAWKNPQGSATLFCSPVSLDDLPEDSVLASVPGIFQALVDKAFEIRVTVIGKLLYAVKLHSQEVSSARIDWRAATEQVRLEPISLAGPLEDACHAVMKDLGIVFGCFDLVVTPEGDCVFLEVNEMGAFLWLEEHIPELLLADAFCEFLCQGRVNVDLPSGQSRIKLEDVHEAALRRMKASAPPHHIGEPDEASSESV
jgi:hypothetical protein